MAYKVMVIDDEPDVLRYLETVLADGGYEVQTAVTGEEGYKRSCEWVPNLICLDVMMPKHSGISIYRKLKNDPKTCNIPVMILTGIEKGDGFNFQKWAGDDTLPPPEYFLEKPIKVAGFLKVVGGLVGSRKVNSK